MQMFLKKYLFINIMDKLLKSLIFGLVLIFSAMSVFGSATVVAGKIYNADFSQTISGATVEVTCAAGEIKTTTSRPDGSYNIVFTPGKCTTSSVTVNAYFGDLYGTETSIINGNVLQDMDLAIANVPLVPEFGLITGFITLFGALSYLFIARRA